MSTLTPITIPSMSAMHELTNKSIKESNYIDVNNALEDIVEKMQQEASKGHYHLQYKDFNFNQPTDYLHDNHQKVMSLLKEQNYSIDHYSERGQYCLSISW